MRSGKQQTHSHNRITQIPYDGNKLPSFRGEAPYAGRSVFVEPRAPLHPLQRESVLPEGWFAAENIYVTEIVTVAEA